MNKEFENLSTQEMYEINGGNMVNGILETTLNFYKEKGLVGTLNFCKEKGLAVCKEGWDSCKKVWDLLF